MATREPDQNRGATARATSSQRPTRPRSTSSATSSNEAGARGSTRSSERRTSHEDEELDDEDLTTRSSTTRTSTTREKRRTSTRRGRARAESSRPRRRNGKALEAPKPRRRRRRPWRVGRGPGQASRVRHHLRVREGRRAAGPKITIGLQGGAPGTSVSDLAPLPTASFVIIASIAARHLGELDPLPRRHRPRAQAQQHRQGRAAVPDRSPGSGPQTILILGSDKRNKEISGKYGLSDTTMLLRLDPDRNAIALLSLPRDLKVDIPGYGTDKLNAAYSLGARS